LREDFERGIVVVLTEVETGSESEERVVEDEGEIISVFFSEEGVAVEDEDDVLSESGL
jgi:hypothetical protein